MPIRSERRDAGSRKKGDLQKLVRENVETGSSVHSDALKSYDGLAEDFTHQVVDHARCYVNGQVHTNGMENFWSLLNLRTAVGLFECGLSLSIQILSTAPQFTYWVRSPVFPNS